MKATAVMGLLVVLPVLAAGCTTNTTIVQQPAPDGGAPPPGTTAPGATPGASDGGADAAVKACSEDGSHEALIGAFDVDPGDPDYWTALVFGSDCRICYDIDVVGPDLKSNGDTFKSKRMPDGAIAVTITQPKYPAAERIDHYLKDGVLYQALGDGSPPDYNGSSNVEYRRASRGYTCDGEKP